MNKRDFKFVIDFFKAFGIGFSKKVLGANINSTDGRFKILFYEKEVIILFVRVGWVKKVIKNND